MCSSALGVLSYFSNFQIDNVRTFLKWDTNIEIYGTNQQASGQQSGGGASRRLLENFHFHSLCQQLGNLPSRLLYGFGRNSPPAPVLYSTQCSKAKELDMLSFTKLFMKVSLLHCLKIQKESNFDSLRQWQEGPGDSRVQPQLFEALLLKMQFLLEDFFPPVMLRWKLLPFWKDFFPMRQPTKVILQICCWDGNILIRYAKIF